MTQTPPSPPGSALVRLSISATDEEWSLVIERAGQRGLSVSRYLVAVALGAAPMDDVREERALLEAVRRLRRLLPDGEGPDGMRERLTVLFAACGLVTSGRTAELSAVLAPVLGEEVPARVAAAPEARPTGRRKSGEKPSDQGMLL